LLEEDLIDYRATPEHSDINVNVIMFSADYTTIVLSVTINQYRALATAASAIGQYRFTISVAAAKVPNRASDCC
jgi:hypothetical protein